MVNNIWREFVRGELSIILLNIIQREIESFCKFIVINNLSLENMNDHPVIKQSLVEDDISELKHLIKQEFIFIISGKTVSCRVIHFKSEYKRIVGYRDYKIRLKSSSEAETRIEKLDKFFHALNGLIHVRNVYAHDNSPINDTGFALNAAAQTFTILESCTSLNPGEITPVQKNLKKLFDEIIVHENLGNESFEDEEKNPKNEVEQDKLVDISESVKKIFEKQDQLSSKLDKIKLLVSNEINETSFSEKKISKKNSKTTTKITKLPELKKTNFELHDALDREVSDLREEAALASQSLSPLQAQRELLTLQKKFKAKFKCENWENLAQGPFREVILNFKIKNIEDLLKSEPVALRYERYKDSFNKQIESDLGKEFVSILERILFD